MSDYSKGVKEGQTDAILADHAKHLAKINGNIERFALASERLASEIRTLQEEGRLAEERVRVAAETLAKETERRRVALADTVNVGDRKFSKTQWAVGIFFTTLGLLLTYYLATRKP